MKIKSKVSVHNRFDIVKNGEWIGFAENIILDQTYSRLCNFQSYFVNIHFGTGAGTPMASRSSLFAHLGTKIASVEEVVTAFPTSKVTKKITLNPEEYIDSILTEVGIAYGATNTYLMTHAMIKDSEGNPLSIEKGSLDVVEIYASVFVTLINNETLKFSQTAFYDENTKNLLLAYLLNGTTYGTFIDIGKSHDELTTLSNNQIVASNTPTITVDISNKKRTYSARFSISQGGETNGINEFGLRDILRFRPITSERIEDYAIETADGIKTEFDLPFTHLSNLVTKLNGVVLEYSEYIDNQYKGFMQLTELLDYTYNNYLQMWLINLFAVENSNEQTAIVKLRESINGKNIFGEFMGTSSLNSQLSIYSSADGSEWSLLKTFYSKNSNIANWELNITDDNLYYKFNSGGYTSQYIRNIRLLAEKPVVRFSTPPISGGVITISGDIPYYPKDENHLLDVTFEITFGEGV